MTFEYTRPCDVTVRRQFTADSMSNDTYAIVHESETLAVVGWKLARSFWLHKISLAELLKRAEGGNGSDA